MKKLFLILPAIALCMGASLMSFEVKAEDGDENPYTPGMENLEYETFLPISEENYTSPVAPADEKCEIKCGENNSTDEEPIKAGECRITWCEKNVSGNLLCQSIPAKQPGVDKICGIAKDHIKDPKVEAMCEVVQGNGDVVPCNKKPRRIDVEEVSVSH